ncbi:hypothetical protein F4678DRAFT_483533 [Xylaria arbuscula]|nr:hypothetical protein F4678DRAFT_483533 [Xylaria arbuscula]
MSSERISDTPVPSGYEPKPKDFLEEIVQSSVKPNAPHKTLLSPVELPWRPFYLRRRVLSCFILVFLLLIIAIIALSQLSYRNHGLVTSYTGLHYLWTYGPTAILTLVGAGWARVSFQAKLIAPWIYLHRKPVNVEKALLLDYIAMFPPLVMFRSFKNRHFLVATTSTVSSLLSILIVLSSGLITLSPTPVHKNNIPVVLQTSFVNNATNLLYGDSIPWLTMTGLISGVLKNPDGVTERFAYQTFDTDLPTTAEVRATVDAISTGLDCENASLDSFSTYRFLDQESQAQIGLNLTLSSPTCHTGVPDVGITPLNGSEVNATHPISSGYYVGFMTPRNCKNASNDFVEDFDIVVILFGLLQLSPKLDNNVSASSGFDPNATTLRSTQLICRPTYSMTHVNVIRNGSEVESLVSSNPHRSGSLDNITAWDIYSAYFYSYSQLDGKVIGWTDQLTDLAVCGESLNVDDQFRMALSDSSKVQCPVDLFLQSEYLMDFMTAHYQRYTAVLAHHLIMEPTSTPSTGTAIIIEDRLLVRTFAAQSMAGLIAAAVLLSAIASTLIPRSPILEFSPNTLIAQGILASRSHDICQALEDMEYVIQEPLSTQNNTIPLHRIHLETSTEQYSPLRPTKKVFPTVEGHLTKAKGGIGVSPLTIRKHVRITTCFLVFTMISTLETTLHFSNRNSGLGSVTSDAYLHYLWTTIPSVVMSLLSLYFSAVDFDLRALTSYHLLKAGAPFDHTVNLNLLDKSAPRIALNQWKIRAFFGLASTVAMFAASLFTIFTSSLFVAESIPQSSLSHLFTVDSFRESNPAIISNKDGYTSALLVLEASVPYPAFTYQNLVIPRLTLSPDSKIRSKDQDKELHTPTFVYTASVPAFRTNLTCELYDSSRFIIEADYGDDYWENRTTPLGATISIRGVSGSFHVDYLFTNIGVFGFVTAYSISSWQYLYVWGNINPKLPTNLTFAAGMACNDTIEVIDIEATFVGASLNIDTTKPPMPIESTARKLIQNDSDRAGYGTGNPGQDYYPNIYSDVPAFVGSHPSLNIDGFFDIVTSSRYAQPHSALGDPARREDIIHSIELHHGIITAALLVQSRVPLNNTNATIHLSGNDADVYNTTATDPNGVIRVIQQGTSTRILESLLLITLVLSIISWALMPNTALLPKPPTSLASAVALLVGGNIFACLPPNAASMSSEELKSHFLGLGFDKFKIGWAIVTSKKEGEQRERFMVYAVSSKASQLMGSNLEVDTDEVGVGIDGDRRLLRFKVRSTALPKTYKARWRDSSENS